ncbi:DUF805 domain-containing protein [Microbacterium luticocti]|uniref:DUF805 domain-containing protein n=1 Tax=Microbacterium luticocti TaxID=451764 RepID=UPI0004100E08|nr:DUF805 domain-containing protein [Microbacterium luticocti]
MTTNTPQPPAGWYPDPQDSGQERWWNGVGWSTQTRPAAPVTAGTAAPTAAQPTWPQTSPGAAAGTSPGAAGTQHPGVTASSYPGATGGTYPGAAAGTYPGAGAYPGYAAYAPPIGIWRSPADDRPVVTGLGGAVRTVFAKYATFAGRAGRPEFWYWTLFNGLIACAWYVAVTVFVVIANTASYRSSGGMAGVVMSLVGLLMLAWWITVFVPWLAVTVRRLRDAGFHWGLIFLSLLPFGGIAVIVMCCMPSKYA